MKDKIKLKCRGTISQEFIKTQDAFTMHIISKRVCVPEMGKAVRLFLDQDYYNIAHQIQQQMINDHRPPRSSSSSEATLVLAGPEGCGSPRLVSRVDSMSTKLWPVHCRVDSVSG